MNLYNHSMQLSVANTYQIEPIADQQKIQVVDRTLEVIAKASELYDQKFLSIPIAFDLRGKCAGMYRRSGREKLIRFNPWLFAKYYQHSLEQTVPHEVAHYITDCLWSGSKVKPHGKEWKSVMQLLGAEPAVTGNYDLTGIPLKQYQQFDYSCGCKTHQLSIIRHRRLVKGQAEYRCRSCQGLLQAVAK